MFVCVYFHSVSAVCCGSGGSLGIGGGGRFGVILGVVCGAVLFVFVLSVSVA